MTQETLRGIGGPQFARAQEIPVLRITTRVAADGGLTICVAGRLTQEGCEAIDQLLQDGREQGRSITIDLGGVRLVDSFSIKYLADANRRHVMLINLPPYVSRWIKQIRKRT